MFGGGPNMDEVLFQLKSASKQLEKMSKKAEKDQKKEEAEEVPGGGGRGAGENLCRECSQVRSANPQQVSFKQIIAGRRTSR